MAHKPKAAWAVLDKELRRQSFLERAGQHVTRPLLAGGLALAFLGLCALAGLSLAGYGEAGLLVAGAAFAGYMALNIGANDIGNNMGPVIGARAAPFWLALSLAAMAELMGALLAGGPVIQTIGFGLVGNQLDAAESGRLARVMLAGLIAGGLWVNIATLLAASISTTHAVVGGIIGAGLVAFGAQAVDWPALAAITFGWVISPVIGGVIAAGLLLFVTRTVKEAADRRAAAVAWVPRLTGAMAGTFIAYLLLGGLAGAIALPPLLAGAAGLAAGLAVTWTARPACRRQAAAWPPGRPPSAKAVRGMFSLPLLAAALLFSFAHGANDVSNAVGPLAAIIAAGNGTGTGVPPAVPVIGGLGIALGVLLFGPRLVRVIGNEITKLNPVRAFCVLLSAAMTATAASWAGLPVSSTHIALGGIFGIGFWREAHEARLARTSGTDRGAAPPPEERRRRKLVRRSMIFTMIGAWIVTVPVSAALAAGVFLILDRL